SFERGETYFRDGAVLEPVRQAMELRAQCEGSDYEPYQVSATLAKSGIVLAIDEFALGLSQCFKKSKADAETRRAWLEALLQTELTDIEMGGIDLAPSAREAVLE